MKSTKAKQQHEKIQLASREKNWEVIKETAAQNEKYEAFRERISKVATAIRSEAIGRETVVIQRVKKKKSQEGNTIQISMNNQEDHDGSRADQMTYTLNKEDHGIPEERPRLRRKSILPQDIEVINALERHRSLEDVQHQADDDSPPH